MKLKNNSLIAGGFAHPKNRLPTNSSEANNLLKTFQTPNSGSAQKVIRINLSSLHTSLRGAQILSENIIYSQKKDSVQAVLIWTQQGIKKNGYEINYIRLAHSLQSSAGGWDLNRINNIYLVQHSNLVKDVHSVDCLVSLPTFETESVQPFGSMPRDCNSFLMMRLIQADIDSSPSASIACLIDNSNCGSTLKAICLLPLGNFVFDICNTLRVCCLCLTVYNTFRVNVKQRSPEVLPTLTGLLITTDNKAIEVTMSKHNTPVTGRNSFTPNIKFIQHHSAKFFAHHSAKFLAQQSSAKNSADYKPVKNNLPLLVEFSYIDSAPYKTGVRIGVLNLLTATHDAPSVFFCVHAYVHLLNAVLYRAESMVAAAEQPKGWLESVNSSNANSTVVTTPEIGVSSGDSLTKLTEIIPMMTIPNSAYPKFKKHLHSFSRSGYIHDASEKSEVRFDSLNRIAGSRLDSDMRYFCARKPTYPRIMAGRDGGAYALAGSYSASLSTPLRLATPFDSEVARLHRLRIGAANMASSAYPKFKKHLHSFSRSGYIHDASEKSEVRFDSLNISAGSRLDSDMRYFCARKPTYTRIMAGRDGEAFAPAGSRNASLSTPLRLATPFDSEVARLLKSISGASIMASSAYPKFLWRFFSCQQSKFFTVEATSEQEARSMLPDAPCLFSARIRQGVNHG